MNRVVTRYIMYVYMAFLPFIVFISSPSPLNYYYFFF